jgi:hypothetical protein
MNLASPLTGIHARTGKAAFWILFGVSTSVVCGALLFAATPSTNHSSDAVIFGLATILAFIALLVGVVQKAFHLASLARFAGVVLAAELVVSGWLLIDALTHLHKL